MKNLKIKIISLFLLILFFLIISSYSNITKKSAFPDEIFAIEVDGVESSAFPSKGRYKVTATCDNADATWDYDAWKINIENITGNVTCDVKFTSIEEKRLNEYLTSLRGMAQGDGKFVFERLLVSIPNYTKGVALEKSEYQTPTLYYTSNSATENSGTTFEASKLTFDENTKEWTFYSSSPAWRFWHMKFPVKEDAYYQVCYSITSGSTSNRTWIYNGESAILEALKSSSSAQSGCVNLGFVKSTSYIKLVQVEVSPFTTLKFQFKKVDGSNVTVEEVDADYRFEGKNPNNYIWYNNELWRILGVFDERTHGQTGENLVKIIRTNSLGGLTLHNTDNNQWEYSNMKNLLQGYVNKSDMTTDICLGNASSYTTQANCDYRYIGLNDTAKSMIQDTLWLSGGITSTAITSGEMFMQERSIDANVSALAGLIYPSDYGFSVLAEDCPRTTDMSAYNDASCVGRSWLSGYKWTMTPLSGTTNTTYIDINGGIVGGTPTQGAPIHPVIYLKSSVYLLDGDGSIKNPYKIGI